MTLKQQYEEAMKEFPERFVKVPCDCPKGGLIGENEIVCPKCNGTEWVADKEISEWITSRYIIVAEQRIADIKSEIEWCEGIKIIQGKKGTPEYTRKYIMDIKNHTLSNLLSHLEEKLKVTEEELKELTK